MLSAESKDGMHDTPQADSRCRGVSAIILPKQRVKATRASYPVLALSCPTRHIIRQMWSHKEKGYGRSLYKKASPVRRAAR